MLFLGDKLSINIMVEYMLEQRIFLYDAYVKYSSARRCRRNFQYDERKVQAIRAISEQELLGVNQNLFRRYIEYFRVEGHQLQHLL